MKILDKLKNTLFEEEYVEIEEKPKKVKPEKQKKEQPKKDSFHKEEKKFVEEKPIAKRIVPTEKKENSVEKEEKNEFIRDNEFTKPKEEPKFTIVTDEDLTVDDTKYQKPPVEKEIISHKTRETIKREELYNNKEQKEPEVKLYQAKKTESYLDNYTPHEYGKYEKKKEKEVFKPSPIISPIYGIVSDTDQEVREQKQEIRLTSAISHEKMDLDEIRKKAFGDLTDDLKDNINYGRTTTVVKEEKEEPSNLLLDLTDETKAPEISNVTMGDAEEYFEDLGLEYNKDYIDSSKTTRVEKNANLDQERKAIPVTDGQNSSTILIKDKKNENEVETNKDKEEKPDDSNLFDLIDSMYEE